MPSSLLKVNALALRIIAADNEVQRTLREDLNANHNANTAPTIMQRDKKLTLIERGAGSFTATTMGS